MASHGPMASGRLGLLGLGVAILSGQGCSGADIQAPAMGVIAVAVTTSGAEPDPDGYTLSLDNLGGSAIDPVGSRDLTVAPGDHTLGLSGLAANCAVQGDEGAQRTVHVNGGDTVAVAFDVLCGATTGALTITTATSGASPDPDGYTVTVDQGSPQPISPSGTLSVDGLSPGDHTVSLAGIAANCIASGDNPRTVAVAAGTAAQTVFDIVCVGAVSRWTPVDAGTAADLTDVWGTAANDVFIVGEMAAERGTQVASIIRHFDGTGWVEQHQEVDLQLRGLWGSSPADVYAVGSEFLGPVARMFHYDGSAWTEVPGFAADAEELGFEAVWGTSSQDVFAVGGASDGEFDRALIYHFDGSFWQRMLVPGDVNPTLTDVWGASPTDVWAVGRDETASPNIGVVLHFDGTTWTPALQEDGLSPNAVWGSSATDVFLAGFQVEEDTRGNFKVTSAIWHYDGSTWTRMSVPSGSTVLDDIWGTSSSDVYAVGDDGLVLHFDGTVWTGASQTDRELLAVWGSGPADLYAVGFGGRVIHGTP